MTSQLVEVAEIVGDLGRNIGEAQQILNLSYIEGLRDIVDIVKDVGGLEGNKAAQDLIKALAPARYQYTETVLDFSADLAERSERSIKFGGSVTMKVIAVNAAMTLGYGHDYRASARITTTLHAYHDPTMGEKLLARATAIRAANVTMPERFGPGADINKGARELIKAMGAGDAGDSEEVALQKEKVATAEAKVKEMKKALDASKQDKKAAAKTALTNAEQELKQAEAKLKEIEDKEKAAEPEAEPGE